MVLKGAATPEEKRIVFITDALVDPARVVDVIRYAVLSNSVAELPWLPYTTTVILAVVLLAVLIRSQAPYFITLSNVKGLVVTAAVVPVAAEYNVT
jgi:hypothetical protein